MNKSNFQVKFSFFENPIPFLILNDYSYLLNDYLCAVFVDL